MLINNSLILYILLSAIITLYIIYRVVDNKNKRIAAARRFFNRLNYIDLEIGLLEGEAKAIGEDDDKKQ